MSKDQFKTRLEIAKNKILKRSKIPKDASSSKLGIAFKMSTEMVAAVLVGTIIGFILDNWFGTKPWLILIFFFCRSDRGYSKCGQICKENAK